MYKFIVLATIVAYASAGFAPVAYAPAVSTAVGTSAQSVSRSLDGGSSVSQYSKAVDTAFSSVRKYDTRVTNDARYVAPFATYAHAAPVATYAHAAPVVAPAVAAYAHAAPVVAARAYAPAVATYAHAAPVVAARAYAPAVATYAHAAPVVAARAAVAPVAHAGLLGVAYSAAPAVSHGVFDGFGAHYGW